MIDAALLAALLAAGLVVLIMVARSTLRAVDRRQEAIRDANIARLEKELGLALPEEPPPTPKLPAIYAGTISGQELIPLAPPAPRRRELPHPVVLDDAYFDEKRRRQLSHYSLMATQVASWSYGHESASYGGLPSGAHRMPYPPPAYFDEGLDPINLERRMR